MKRSIRAAVEGYLLSGMTAEQAQAAARLDFPLKCVGMNYVSRIERDLDRDEFDRESEQ